MLGSGTSNQFNSFTAMLAMVTSDSPEYLQTEQVHAAIFADGGGRPGALPDDHRAASFVADPAAVFRLASGSSTLPVGAETLAGLGLGLGLVAAAVARRGTV